MCTLRPGRARRCWSSSNPCSVPPPTWHEGDWDAIRSIPDEDLSRVAQSDRTHLVEVVRRRLTHGGLAAGRSPSESAWTELALDPGTLTICFARRMAAHKRASLLLEQPDRLRALVAERPVQFVFAGKAHPGDDAGKETIRSLVAFASEPAMRGRFVFVEDYDMALARAMVQGADVWLNTPLHPLEASGTSGMKAALNGALNLSVLDGWWAEGFDIGSRPDVVPNGWAIAATRANGGGDADPARRSRLDCDALYELIENQVLDLWSQTAPRRGRRPWWEWVRRSLTTLGPLVDAHRMVRQYTEGVYAPAVATSAALNADGHAGARRLAAFRRRVVANWDDVRIASVEVDETTGDLGSTRSVSASVMLGRLDVDDVEVQLLVGHLGPGGGLVDPEVTTMSAASGPDGPERNVTYSGSARLSVPGRMGLTVRVLPSEPLLHTQVDLGLVTWAD
ncbi:MAG: alpha-glucan family phosphorylase [Microthrixaceae bacterium]|nr:alpha-glucan family phosphorylase [Microthrixaceae bacterium]